MDMTRITFAFAGFLFVLGVGAYVVTGAQSVTALIPAFFAVAFALSGFVARRNLKAGMHAAALLAILGLLGTARSLTKLPALFGGGDLERPAAVAVQAIMALACLGFVALAVKSFIDARRAAV
jgi:hypothetical protein